MHAQPIVQDVIGLLNVNCTSVDPHILGVCVCHLGTSAYQASVHASMPCARAPTIWGAISAVLQKYVRELHISYGLQLLLRSRGPQGGAYVVDWCADAEHFVMITPVVGNSFCARA